MVEQLEKINKKIGYFRWTICGLLFLAATINYIDRNVVSILKQDVILTWPGWSEEYYGYIIAAFTLAYALMMLVAGALIDRIGIRKGLLIAIIWWSFAAMGHAISGTVLSFAIWRIMLGIGEAAYFPASIKAVAEWFPKKERALATGIFNAGTNIGAMVTPYLVFWIMSAMGSWRWAFIMTGVLASSVCRMERCKRCIVSMETRSASQPQVRSISSCSMAQARQGVVSEKCDSFRQLAPAATTCGSAAIS